MSAKKDVWKYAPPRLFPKKPPAQGLRIHTQDVFVAAEKETIQTVVQEELKPELRGFLTPLFQTNTSVNMATETQEGLIRLATFEEAWQGIASDVGMTPKRAQEAFVTDKNYVDTQERLRNKIALKVEADDLMSLADLEVLQTRIGSNLSLSVL